MSIIVFIPVRGGSKSIPLKNIKIINGKPLVYWSILAAQNCKKIDKIIVATDSDRIANVVDSLAFNKVTVYKRSVENAQDDSTTESVVLEYLNEKKTDENDTFILIQATSPLLNSKDLENGLDIFQKDNVDSVLSGVISKRFLWNENGPINYDYRSRPRRQDFDGTFLENGAFYINSIGNIMRYKNRLCGKIGLCIMDDDSAIEIDEPKDWGIVEKLLKKRHSVLPNYKRKVKLFLTDVDGVLTDAGMYYSTDGNEMKKFNTHDGKGFELLKKRNIKTGIITSEDTNLVKNRANKLKVDYLFQGAKERKLEIITNLLEELNLGFEEVAYIGDDINDFDLLSKVGISACPKNAVSKIKDIPHIIQLERKGGDGTVREFIEMLISKDCLYESN
ncbi:acylneuraminate cytidylyltransferase [Spirochaeta cellobiosiphila]|uniref:acylneuraminate cytidylyltransferase n=1 Tax=Spirochaeta cellobiosiphila TaxID=504483 RepID=UPI0004287DDE|nr:acylneuraminate cytidylyltransferase [Spirochaeta cellobiosiphila]